MGIESAIGNEARLSFGVTSNRGYEDYLCPAAEPKLVRSIERGHNILINENLLLKFDGRLVALCLEDFTLPNGSTFREGMWYAVDAHVMQSKFVDAYRRGETSVVTTDEIDWRSIRMLDNSFDTYDHRVMSGKELLEYARDYARTFTGVSLSPEDAAERWNISARSILF